ncbi:PREDICTED: microtubule-associated protein 1S-like [Cyprinodon variegatus]|uniref:microtubule-associated protein 1S-like n=1 Tax=Cyprinodon variegatus TaxID=28743 RepID=UPI0007425F66|nr:PREDICTED: microtubule-associated protein 1S-like [Cyprinodon variegatus]
MACSRVLEREVQEEQKSATQDFCPHKYSLLIIIGRTARHRQTENIRAEIEKGIRSWDVDLKSCNLNLFLQEFLSHHTASFKGAGQKCLRHCTKVLDTQVLISPSQELAYSEVFSLLSRDSAHKLLILAGLSLEESGELLFHRGQFSPDHLRQIITEQFLDHRSCVSLTKTNLTLSCPNIGHWRKILLGNSSLQGPFTLHINPPEVLAAMESLGDFTSLISGTICPTSPFDLLSPPTTVGFLKLSRPCCYVFPAGRGDCAFFAVNGFTVLVDGGSDSQACFWKLVRHLDRVDAVLLTHIGTENLPGAVSFLERKVAEKELSNDVKDDLSKRLISPELGVVFFNAPNKLQAEQHSLTDNILKSTQQAAITLELLKKLEIRPQPMFRPQGTPIKPLTLFQKMGVGQLDLYILSPGKNSQEYEIFLQNWPNGDPSLSQSLPLTAQVSVSALLVWHPACPQEKVVRVLFPGATPQAKLLQGLEKLKGLDFLQRPTVTTGDLERQGEDMKAKRMESLDSGRTLGKDVASKRGKERETREEGKDVLVKEKVKTSSGTKDTDKTKIKEVGLKRKPSLSEKNTLKKGSAKDGKKEEKAGNKEENNVKRTEQIKRDGVLLKPKRDNKAKPKKDTRNDKTGEKKTQKSSESDDKKGHTNNSSEQKRGSLSKITEPEPLCLDKQNNKRETEAKEKQYDSKVSTPEDMTADFLRLQKESELEKAESETLTYGDLECEKILGGVSEDEYNVKPGRLTEEAVGGLEIVKVEIGDSLVQTIPGKSEKTEADLLQNCPEQLFKSSKPAKVVGFPSPLNKSYKSEQTDQLDTTPTEYTLLDGALRHSPPSHTSPENQAPNSPDEETVEPVSPDSRPNSAGHTPYCLSPDDMWCNRATLSRLQALHSADACEPNGYSGKSEEVCKTKSTAENPKEKHLNFLSFGTCREGSSDPSPSLTTTTTTHSLPAEVGSPQSTEVDESLSMSFEQGPTIGSHREGDDGVYLSQSNGGYCVGKSLPAKKPPRSVGQSSEMGRPTAPNTLHFEASAHDVDLCLVSPCEFKHFKPPDSSSGTSEASKEVSGPNHQGNNNNVPKDRSPSESNAPVCTEDCPSTTADGALDSDSDDSCSDPSNSPCNNDMSQTLPPDPLPAPLRDSPPLPPLPDTSMPVPQSNSEAHGKRAKSSSFRGKKLQGIIDTPQKSGSGKNKTGSQSGTMRVNLPSTRTLSSNSRSAPAKASPAPGSKAPSAGEVSIYVDLTYIPSGASSATVTEDFFRCIRSSCYIISGNSLEREKLMRQTLDALLEGKASWPEIMQVTVIPTFESVSMQEWYQQTLDRQRELNITVLGSNSTVAMQDETFPACKIEF